MNLLNKIRLNTKPIFEFSHEADLQHWLVVNDDVMGGRSTSQFNIDADGFGVFEGNISLDNNGGFSSVKYQFDSTDTANFSKVKIRLKGDGKDYQFRIKNQESDYYAYVSPFSTTNEWQEIEIALQDMYPSFRGKRLNQPNFSNGSIEQIMFLIGNKKVERFKLVIQSIELI